MSTSKHTLYNLAGALIPLAVALLTIPLYLRLIGDVRYGVLMLAWVLLGNFGVFDLGLGRALAQRIAALRFAQPDARRTAFWTALGANAFFGLLGAVVLLPVADYFFASMSSIPPGVREEMAHASLWLAAAVPLSTVSGGLSGALQGDARFLALNVSSVIGAVLFQLLPLLAALSGHVELSVLLPVVIISRLVTLAALSTACRDYLAGWKQARFCRGELSTMLKTGGWISLTTLVSPMILAADRVIIGTVSGAAAVTRYGIPYQLGERSTIFSFAVASALFPRFANATPAEASRLAGEGQKVIALVMTPAILVAVVALGPFLAWWVSPEFAKEATGPGQLLLMAFWISGLSKIPHLMLQATGRPDLVAKSLLVQAVPYAILLYACVAAWGPLGAAGAFVIKSVFDSVALSWLTGGLKSLLEVASVPVLLLGGAYVVSIDAIQVTLWQGAAAAALLVAALAWAWSMAPKQHKSAATLAFGSIRAMLRLK